MTNRAESYWRRRAAPVIAAVVEQHQGEDEQVVRAALREAYPFGERSMWPYKVWLDEIRKQLSHRRSTTVERAQKDLFDEGTP